MEPKAVASAITAATVAPIVLYLMVRLLGDSADDPLAVGAAFGVAALLVGGGTALAAI